MAYVERYSNPTGSGLQDGTSPADAWSFVDAIETNLAAGQRLNHQGNVQLPARQVICPTNGTAGSLVGFRGYILTPGDIIGTRGADHKLNETMPKITSGIDGSQWLNFSGSNLDIQGFEFVDNLATGTTTYGLHVDGNFQSFRHCRFDMQGTQRFLDASTKNTEVINCDFFSAGGQHGVSIGRGNIGFCYFEASAYVDGAVRNQGAQPGAINWCTFKGWSQAVNVANVTALQVMNCTAIDCDALLNNPDTTAVISVVNNVAWNSRNTGRFVVSGGNRNMALTHNSFGGFLDMTIPTIGTQYGTIQLSSDPFVSATDLHLNDIPGGGLESKQSGLNSIDRGAWQTLGGGGSSFSRLPNFAGGFGQ